MLALVTGASSGIGRDIAKYLNQIGFDLIITARSRDKLKELKNELDSNNKGKTDIIIADLSNTEECKSLYEIVKEKHSSVDLLVNNAGFGLMGKFKETDLDRELTMIDTNIKAVQILTKLFLKDMIEKDEGQILNVASIAGFAPGPLMSTYYASKSYVVRLSRAIREELRREKSNVLISILCPGPVDTNFNAVANADFGYKGLSSKKVAKYAIDKTLKGKFIIVPGISMKFVRFFAKALPESLMARICYSVQSKKW